MMGRNSHGRSWIGTCGWHYGHWSGRFYPAALRGGGFLAYYAGRFATVEINSAFYRLPAEETLAAWAGQTPAGFVFACKASRFITHMKKLKDPEAGLPVFLERMETLGGQLGPVLFQLPPRWRPNAERLAAFLQALPKGRRCAFELRDPRWHTPEILGLLEKHGCAFCLFELAGERSPVAVTADFVYIRLHGPGAAYEGCYGDAALADWAARIAGWRADGLDVYCYFDNDEKAYAPANARTLIDQLDALQGGAGDPGCARAARA